MDKVLVIILFINLYRGWNYLYADYTWFLLKEISTSCSEVTDFYLKAWICFSINLKISRYIIGGNEVSRSGFRRLPCNGLLPWRNKDDKSPAS